MTAPSLESRIERLLLSLAGVVSVRALASPDGQLEEIHILATPNLHPKQVVRNVESALSAGLGIHVDRRRISVAQVRGDEEFRAAAAAEETRAAAAAPERLVFVRFDVRSQGPHITQCRVVLRRGDAEVTGTGEGPNTPQGRAEAAARALFAALAEGRSRDDIVFEAAALVTTHGRNFVLVSAHGISGRQSVPLTGVAALTRSPEEAAILAALQATNRWTELPS